MRILVALDSFKGTLSGPVACEIVAQRLRIRRPDWQVDTLPLADGGEGTAEALVAACGGTWVDVPDVMGPLPSIRMGASFGWLPGTQTAVVEMARASGLPLLQPGERDPLRTTTYGTGQLLKRAREIGATNILLTLGGSATVDGGAGAATALGWRLLDSAGQHIGHGGQELLRLARIARPPLETAPGPPSSARPCRPEPRVTALCDVDNPLCGPSGAAAVYGPQKGASPEMVARLDKALGHLATVVERDVGRSVLNVPGAGAAGGFGAGAIAFLDAKLKAGFSAVADACELKKALLQADWVVTGEGRLDNQSLHGKVVGGVCTWALTTGTRVAAIAGRIELPSALAAEHGIEIAYAAAPEAMPDHEACARARELLALAADEFGSDVEEITESILPAKP